MLPKKSLALNSGAYTKSTHIDLQGFSLTKVISNECINQQYITKLSNVYNDRVHLNHARTEIEILELFILQTQK